MIATAVRFYRGDLLVWESELSSIFVCSFCKCHLSKALHAFFGHVHCDEGEFEDSAYLK